MKEFHALDPKIAERLGPAAALVLGRIGYFISLARRYPETYRQDRYRNSRWWAKFSITTLHKNMPYYSKRTLQRAIEKLEINELVISCRFSRYKRNHTKYYAINRKQLARFVAGEVDIIN